MKPACLLACTTLVAASLATFPVAAQTSIAEQQDARVIHNLRSNGADERSVSNKFARIDSTARHDIASHPQ
jgi:hypothetical protein